MILKSTLELRLKMKIKLFSILFIFFIFNYAQAEPSPAGVWAVIGEDDIGTKWKAKLSLRPVGDDYPPKKFKGHFDWVGNNGMKGREYIVEGVFNYDTRILRLMGSELEDAHPRVKTSLYTIIMSEDASTLDNGNWKSCGVSPGVWSATRTSGVAEETKKRGKIRKDIPKERCNGPECSLEEEDSPDFVFEKKE